MRSRYLAPVAVGVVVFGAVTAFAASLSVSSATLGAGNAPVGTCNSSAAVSYDTALSGGVAKVTTAPVTTGNGCAGMAYSVTLTGAGNASLGVVTGTLDSSGNASPDFTSSGIAASAVTGVSVVVSG